MDHRKKYLLWVNILGGIAVLGSYVWELTTHPGQGNALWGGVPPILRVVNYFTMPLGAAGWLLLSSYLLFVLDLDTAQIHLGAGFKAFGTLSAVILTLSAFWMPLTFAYLTNPVPFVWLLDRLLLILIGLASLGLLSALMNIQPRRPAGFFWLAFTGGVLFCIQTALMDAFVWANYFLA